jgi:hypothetical protein
MRRGRLPQSSYATIITSLLILLGSETPVTRTPLQVGSLVLATAVNNRCGYEVILTAWDML